MTRFQPTTPPASDAALKETTAVSQTAAKTVNPDASDLSNADKVWTANAADEARRNDRPIGVVEPENLASALGIGAGQGSAPYLMATQADAIAKQTKRK